MSVDYKLIGSRIKERRKACGKTQQRLADDIFVSPGYISQIERGLTHINLETLSEIATILQCDIAEFISLANYHRKDELKSEISDLYNQLSMEERYMLFHLLTTYISKKSR